MLRGILIATIVAAFPLSAVAAGPVSEDIPIPGGTAAVAGAAGLPETPDRSRFVSEITRLVFEAPSRERLVALSPALAALSPGSRLSAHLFAASRLQRALAGVPQKTISLADADGGTRRQLTELLDVIGLRFRERRGTLAVEPNGNPEAAQRAMLLGNLGVDVSGIADALNRGKAVTLTLPADVVPLPLSAAVWSDVILQRKVPPVELFAAILADDRAALLCHGLAGLDDLTLQYLSENPAILRGAVHAGRRVLGVRQPPQDPRRPRRDAG